MGSKTIVPEKIIIEINNILYEETSEYRNSWETIAETKNLK
jgi:hypothetical protein